MVMLRPIRTASLLDRDDVFVIAVGLLAFWFRTTV